MSTVATGLIAAIIVTHNRLSLLQECVAAVRAQSVRPHLILVVDNDSTDGTREWLQNQPDVQPLLQMNLGGAGGFHAGMMKAYQQGYTWVWCMDDDGYPEQDCLKRLLEDGGDILYRAPLVLDRENYEKLAFVLTLPEDNARLTTHMEAQKAAHNGCLYGIACPFNGVLLHRDLMSAIGFPLKNMFMWGDEMEYFMRTERAGYTVSTIVSAIHFHPRDRMKTVDFTFLGRRRSVTHAGSPLHDYLAARNQTYLTRKYHGWNYSVRHAIRYVMFYSIRFGPRAGLWALNACIRGLFGILSGHHKYIDSGNDRRRSTRSEFNRRIP